MRVGQLTGQPDRRARGPGRGRRLGRRHGVPVLSDECYIEFTWDGPGRTILAEGTEGVVALHSLSKRSNFAGARVGFYAGDRDLVHYLSEVRKHAGFMVPGPVQAAAVVAFGDDVHVDVQRERYLRRLDLLAMSLCEFGVLCARPPATFYLWVAAPDGDAWALAHLAGDRGWGDRLPRRVLRTGRGWPCPHRRRAARRPPRAGRQPAGCGLAVDRCGRRSVVAVEGDVELHRPAGAGSTSTAPDVLLRRNNRLSTPLSSPALTTDPSGRVTRACRP